MNEWLAACIFTNILWFIVSFYLAYEMCHNEPGK